MTTGANGYTTKIVVSSNFDSYTTTVFGGANLEGVFVSCTKDGSTLYEMTDTIAHLASYCLSIGGQWEKIRAILIARRFDPHDDKHDSVLCAMAAAVDSHFQLKGLPTPWLKEQT